MEHIPSQCSLELLHNLPQLPPRALRALVLHCNFKALLRLVSVSTSCPSSFCSKSHRRKHAYLELPREYVQVIPHLRRVLLL